MPHRNLAACVRDLEQSGQLRVIDTEVDPYLEVGSIQRRVYQAGGPALLFRRVRGTTFPMLGNLFGTLQRTRYIFRDTLETVERLVELKARGPEGILRHPWRYRKVPWAALHMKPRRTRHGPILAHETTISALPKLVSWPKDGGPYVTLPLVYTEDPDRPGPLRSNLGMYRVQLGGNAYEPDWEVGLHYQIHRGIGVHHTAALRRGEPLPVNVIVGGPPAWTIAAVMPLPEGLPELAFAGALAGRAVQLVNPPGLDLPIPAEADFVIAGRIDPEATRPEGPFGDHLGYYSLAHAFPYLKVERVYHRPGAIWPFTTVGRPPQEDTTFGDFIHELTGPALPTVLPGVRAVNAVDAAGVHPLLLAIGSERYTPYAAVTRPMELLTQAHAILGQGQLSLAKYLFIINGDEAPELKVNDIPGFFRHVLERVDWSNDLHFQTRTTIDTLDYTGEGLNQGSKLVVAAAGPKRRDLPTEQPLIERPLPHGLKNFQVVMPGVLAIEGPPYDAQNAGPREALEHLLLTEEALGRFPLIVLTDDSAFTAASLNNWLWVTFTRSNPASDVSGAAAFIDQKHWGCRGPLVIDARRKPHHAPPLEADPEVERRVDSLAAPGGPLHGLY